ncbi:hypothetical protein ACHAPO_010316 [Fusarium lateritium]
MKPVNQSDLEGLVNLGSILILDVTSWGLNFVYETICRSPSHITSKTGNNTLPTELWLEIISHVKSSTNDDAYEAVYPIEIQSVQIDGGEAEPVLICNVLENWRRCGTIRHGWDVGIYENYLNNPSHVLTEEEKRVRPNQRPPFQVSSVAKDPMYAISLSYIETRFEFLFHDIKVPDVISCLEYGDCRFCYNRTHSVKRPKQDDDIATFCGEISHHPDCEINIICPLCIGVDYASTSISTACYCVDDDDRLPHEEHCMYFNNRFRELGYVVQF